MKKCNSCKQILDLSRFTKNKNSEDGLDFRCRDCKRKDQQKRNEKLGIKSRPRPSVFNEKEKQCLACFRILPLEEFSPTKRGRFGKGPYCKKCAAKKMLKEEYREYRKNHMREVRKTDLKYVAKNRLYNYNRKNLIEALDDNTVTTDFIKEIYETENCFYCGLYTHRDQRTIEHRLPLSRGGAHSISNIVMACHSCNSSKAAKTEEEYLEFCRNNNRLNICELNKDISQEGKNDGI